MCFATKQYNGQSAHYTRFVRFDIRNRMELMFDSQYVRYIVYVYYLDHRFIENNKYSGEPASQWTLPTYSVLLYTEPFRNGITINHHLLIPILEHYINRMYLKWNSFSLFVPLWNDGAHKLIREKLLGIFGCKAQFLLDGVDFSGSCRYLLIYILLFYF